MSIQDLGALGEFLAAIATIATLIYLALQIRANTRATSAHSRHSISDFARSLAEFRALHADRIAKIETSEELSRADEEFLFWLNLQMLLHGETYFHQHEMGLLPDSHWRSYHNYMRGFLPSKGVAECWERIGSSFPEEYRAWVEKLQSEISDDA